KKKVAEPAATIRNPRKSRSDGPMEIQRKTAKKVRSNAATIAMRERRASARPIATKSRTKRQSQTAVEVWFFPTQIQISGSESNGRKFFHAALLESSASNFGQTAKPACAAAKTT